jgi:hypothetical protein
MYRGQNNKRYMSRPSGHNMATKRHHGLLDTTLDRMLSHTTLTAFMGRYNNDTCNWTSLTLLINFVFITSAPYNHIYSALLQYGSSISCHLQAHLVQSVHGLLLAVANLLFTWNGRCIILRAKSEICFATEHCTLNTPTTCHQHQYTMTIYVQRRLISKCKGGNVIIC